jgi:Ca2+-binding EF-hand superfamily protein
LPYVDIQIDCKEFLRHFLHLGIAERNKVKQEQLDRQRREDREREEEHQRKLFEAANRQTFTVDMDFADADRDAILQKLAAASEGFDKTHPAAPSLEAFEVAYLTPGLFRENLKRVFNVLASPKEIGYLMSVYDKQKLGKIDSKEFMIKFLATGKKIRDDKRKAFLEEQRLAEKQAREEEERKVSALWDKAELLVDYDTSGADLKSAIEKMTEASYKYDKTHPSAPSLDGFSGGPIKPGVFRELVRRAFNIWFEPKELGAVVKRYPHERLKNMVDGKVFLQGFMKLGYDARARTKAYTLQKQRQDELNRKNEAELKLRQSEQRVALDVETEFSEQDLKSAMKKLTAASALYDKNSPGCVALDAFDAAYLTPGTFREVVKRTFNLVFEPKELAAVIAQYDNGRGNVDCSKFLVNFIRVGAEEREKMKVIMLEKQRKDDELRRSEHERKVKALEKKLVIKVTYEYNDKERDSAFQKLTSAAKRYDKNHPGAMSLEGFEEKSLLPHVFREMIKRTFGVVLTEPELNACMHFFDAKKTGKVDSRKFLIYFLKLGIAQREEDHKTSLAKLRTDIAMREREHEEKLAAQWAKTELSLTFEFTEEDRNSALQKLSDAAFKFDPASPGPMGLVAFNGKKMTPAVFKEMLRRTFNMKITTAELAALIVEFDKDGSKNIDCSEFMVRFTTLGFDRRSALRTWQLERQRRMDEAAKSEAIEKQRAADAKMEAKLGMDFESEDFNAALEKIRIIASNYDRSHPSAPSLKGFTGTNMKPVEFKDMLMRTFKVALTDKQLGAMVSIFGVEKDEEDFESVRKEVDDGVRIDNAEFLKYFNKIQRDEQAKRNRERIARERELIEQEKERQRQLEIKKKHDEMQRLVYTEADEASLLDNIRHAAQEYAVDSALYMDGMQGFKGPALPPDKFRELFAKIFNIRLSFPEIGVLLSILDLGGIGSLDGTKFLNWFYKICRHEEKFMLGESSDPVTFATLKAASTLAAAGPTRAGTARMGTAQRTGKSRGGGGGSSIARSWADSSVGYMVSDGGSIDSSQQGQSLTTTQSRNRGGMSNNGLGTGKKSASSSYAAQHINSKYSLTFSEGETLGEQVAQNNNAQSFTEATIKTNWILPSITTAATSKPGTASFGSMSQLLEEDAWVAAEETRRHLADVFEFTGGETGSRQTTRSKFTSSAFLEDLDAALATDSGDIFAFDGQLIAPHGVKKVHSKHSLADKQDGERRAFAKHASMSTLSATTSSVDATSVASSAGQAAVSRSHLKTAPAKQQRPRKVPNEILSPIPAPANLLLVPNEVAAYVAPRPRQGTANSPGRRNRSRSPSSPTARGRSPTAGGITPVPSTGDSPQALTSSAKSAKATAQLNPVKPSPVAHAQKRTEDTSFLQAIFAPAHKSPYAQALKVPDRFPTSTTNLQKDPLVKLKLANAHFHDSPIAHMKKKRPDLFVERSVELAAPSTAAFIPNTLATTAPRSSSPTATRSVKGTTKRQSEALKPKISISASADSGAFFFPTLLAATANGGRVPSGDASAVTFADSASQGAGRRRAHSEDATAGQALIPNVPDIGVTGVGEPEAPLDDFAFLRSILH